MSLVTFLLGASFGSALTICAFFLIQQIAERRRKQLSLLPERASHMAKASL